MTDITKISKDELEKDLKESNEDIANCEKALAHGIKIYSEGYVEERLEVNKKCVEVITKELNRRAKLERN